MAEVVVPVFAFGEAITPIPAAAEMRYRNDGRTHLHVDTTAAGVGLNVTHVENVEHVCSHGHAAVDQVDALLAGRVTPIHWGWRLHRFNDASHDVHVLLSATADVLVWAVSFNV